MLHRFCAWHITHKLSEKWGWTDNKEHLTGLVKAAVYQSLTPAEFEESWKILMQEIGYQNDSWFIQLFEIRDKWVPAFLNDNFWARMTTTQWAESMNSFLNKNLKKKSTLGQFVVQFESALKRLYEREIEADHESKYKTPRLITCYPMEEQYRDCYTNELFYRRQHEFLGCVNVKSRLFFC